MFQKSRATALAQIFKLGSRDNAYRRERAVMWNKTVRDSASNFCLLPFYFCLERNPVARLQLSAAKATDPCRGIRTCAAQPFGDLKTAFDRQIRAIARPFAAEF